MKEDCRGGKGKAREDTLRKRYLYKVSANAASLAIGFFTQLLIPRGLGPKAYGDYCFLSNFFNQFVNFFDTGTSLAFYTKLSHRQNERELIIFYGYFVAAVSAIVIGTVAVCGATSAFGYLWPGQGLSYVYLAAGLGIVTWAVKVLMTIIDAYGLTVSGEIAKTIQKIPALFIIALLFSFNMLNLRNFFYYNYIILLILSLLMLAILRREGRSIMRQMRLTAGKIAEYCGEFYKYSHPLFTLSAVGAAAAIFERWLLQVFGGSVQQSFFGLSSQIGVVCFLFTGSMTPLIMREFAIAHDLGDQASMAVLFRKHIPFLFSVTAFFASFAAFNADKIALIAGGEKFKGAAATVAIMAAYTAFQTYGQITGSIFYATARTKLYRNLSVVFTLAGLPVTYILIAPAKLFGMNMGSEGLAVKMTALLAISSNAQLYFIARILKLPFWKYVGHQFAGLAAFLALAASLTFIVEHVFKFRPNVLAGFVTAGALYTLCSAVCACSFPAILGLKRQDLKTAAQIFMRYVKEG